MRSKLPVFTAGSFFALIRQPGIYSHGTAVGKYDIINGYEKRKQMYNLHGLRKMLRGV